MASAPKGGGGGDGREFVLAGDLEIEGQGGGASAPVDDFDDGVSPRLGLWYSKPGPQLVSRGSGGVGQEDHAGGLRALSTSTHLFGARFHQSWILFVSTTLPPSFGPEAGTAPPRHLGGRNLERGSSRCRRIGATQGRTPLGGKLVHDSARERQEDREDG
jgi:hypothetical protein